MRDRQHLVAAEGEKLLDAAKGSRPVPRASSCLAGATWRRAAPWGTHRNWSRGGAVCSAAVRPGPATPAAS